MKKIDNYLAQSRKGCNYIILIHINIKMAEKGAERYYHLYDYKYLCILKAILRNIIINKSVVLSIRRKSVRIYTLK